MTEERRRISLVYAVLVALTFGALLFAAGPVHDVLSARVAAAGAAVLAFVKAWLVAMDFMELRGSTFQRWVQVWFGVIAVVCVVLILR
ncbi:cytochrome C oxidase subunit IV family protein [Mycolicibacterium sp.]|uniref:cytochrome C oxidase subunit IV family protein n=1 Tax=Mycolicibacterium sp. TaxID=2320850 RepID=UPI003D108658